jgi:uncharacterized metal-binding protein YceD (DUF177 family)
MANPMLEPVPPADLANIGQVIETKGKIEDFRRLAEIVDADLSALPEASFPQHWQQATVDITLRFGWIEARPGVPALEGRVATKLAAVCQRCLGPLELVLDTAINLLLPQSGTTPAECDGFEIWEFDENTVRPADIVEEALIMAMPLSALHELSDDCKALLDDERADASKTVRPFEDLRSLMANEDTKD